jgi:hypothetical protein
MTENMEFELEYKTKWRKQAVAIHRDNFAALQALAQEMDALRDDSTKNEKMGFVFRVIEKYTGPDRFILGTMIDLSVTFEEKAGTDCFSGDEFLSMAQEYQIYASGQYGHDVKIEAVYFYFPLDKNNKTENIDASDTDKWLVQKNYMRTPRADSQENNNETDFRINRVTIAE